MGFYRFVKWWLSLQREKDVMEQSLLATFIFLLISLFTDDETQVYSVSFVFAMLWGSVMVFGNLQGSLRQLFVLSVLVGFGLWIGALTIYSVYVRIGDCYRMYRSAMKKECKKDE